MIFYLNIVFILTKLIAELGTITKEGCICFLHKNVALQKIALEYAVRIPFTCLDFDMDMALFFNFLP